MIRDALRTMVGTFVYFLALNLASILIVRMLGVEGRGQFATATLIPTIVVYIGWLGLPTATAYLVAYQPESRTHLIGTSHALGIAFSFLLTLIALVLCLWVPLSDEIRRESLLFCLFIPLNIFFSIDRSVLQAESRSVAYNFLRVSGAIAYVLILALIYILELASLKTVVTAQLLGNLVWFIVASMLVGAKSWLAFDAGSARSLLTYGAKAHIGSLGAVDTLRVDQLILALFLTSYDLGIYVICMTFVLANRLIGNSLGLVAFPTLVKLHKAEPQKVIRVIVGFVSATFALSVLAVAVEIAFGRLLLRTIFDVVDPISFEVLATVCIASILMNTRQVLSDIFRGLGQPTATTYAELVSLIVLAILASAWWEQGVVGIARALLVSATAGLIALIVFGLRSQGRFPLVSQSVRQKRGALNNSVAGDACDFMAAIGLQALNSRMERQRFTSDQLADHSISRQEFARCQNFIPSSNSPSVISN